MIQDDLFAPRPPPARVALSVTELNRRIKALVETEFGTLWVEGEVSNFRPAGSGHQYFTLKDEGSEIPIVFFRGAQQASRVVLRNGLKIRVYGEVTVYVERGRHQVVARLIEEAGVGDLQRAFEALKAKLEAEGLFDPARKRALPALPRHIGLVTSPGGAAVRDLLSILLRRMPRLHVVLAPVRVQGEGAAGDIARAMDTLNRRSDLELLIVGRGGGSIEDLWAFNEEVVARAIARSRLPVVSAVGHETDFTIADFVADLRAPTPSAAAELAVPVAAELAAELGVLGRRVRQALEREALRWRSRLNRAAHSYVFREPGRLLREHRQGLRHIRLRLATRLRGAYVERQQRVDEAQGGLRQAVTDRIKESRHRLDTLAARLRALGPQAVLERGYSITRDGEGRVVTRVEGIAAGQELHTMLADGMVVSKVVTTERKAKR
jgi:exodeoxyribonuclease VII large subunit